MSFYEVFKGLLRISFYVFTFPIHKNAVIVFYGFPFSTIAWLVFWCMGKKASNGQTYAGWVVFVVGPFINSCAMVTVCLVLEGYLRTSVALLAAWMMSYSILCVTHCVLVNWLNMMTHNDFGNILLRFFGVNATQAGYTAYWSHMLVSLLPGIFMGALSHWFNSTDAHRSVLCLGSTFDAHSCKVVDNRFNVFVAAPQIAGNFIAAYGLIKVMAQYLVSTDIFAIATVAAVLPADAGNAHSKLPQVVPVMHGSGNAATADKANESRVPASP